MNSFKEIKNDATLFLDSCPEGWWSFDNACYKFETNLDLGQDKGQEYCSNKYHGHLAVTNSKEEALSLGSYLNGLTVIKHWRNGAKKSEGDSTFCKFL